MRVWIVCGVCALILIGCTRSPFKGYKAIGDELYFRLDALGESERSPADSDSVLMRVRIARLGNAPGSLFSTERWYGLHDSARGFVRSVFGRLRDGDSASVIAHGAYVPWNVLGASNMQRVDTSWVGIELSMRAVRTPAEARAIAAERARLSRTAADEERIINDYLIKSSSMWKQYMSMYYMLDSQNPKADPIHSGELVTVAYTASFVENAKHFDDTHGADHALTFRLGDPGQVIKGIEIALHLLPKGGKGRFIFPSALAFGAQGSSSGIVPPYTPVEYDIEVLDVVGDSTAVLP